MIDLSAHHRSHILTLVILLCLTLFPAGAAAVSASGIDDIPDPALRAVIREALNRPYGDISLSELVDMRRLNGRDRGISDISGLQYLTNLSTLDLSNNEITDLTPLAALYAATEGAKLRHVYLADNQITDVTPLASMTQLATLDLTANTIVDVTPFYREYGLYGVTWLSLAGNQIEDITGLAKLTELEFLALDQNRISDITPLAANLGLGLNDTILLQGNPLDQNSREVLIPEIEARRARVFWGPAVTLTPLVPPEVPVVFADPELAVAVAQMLPEAGEVISAAELAELIELDVSGLGISDLTGLEALTGLTDLDLSDNRITDITALYYLDSLSILDLRDNQIESVWYLLQNSGIDAGDKLDLRGNPLASRSLDDYIPQLEARGVSVEYDPPPQPSTPEPEVVPETSPTTTPPELAPEPVGFNPSAPLKGLLGALGGVLLGALTLLGLHRLRLKRS